MTLSKMEIAKIRSKRFFDLWPSAQLVYEWEDIFSAELKVPIASALYKKTWQEQLIDNPGTRLLFGSVRIIRLLQFTDRFRKSSREELVVDLSVRKDFKNSYSTRQSAIPYLIDFWGSDLPYYEETYKNCKLVLISSLEVYHFLRLQNTKLTIAHLALSLPDKYEWNEEPEIKKYDIIIPGRANSVLDGFLKIFVQRFPTVEYLCQVESGGKLCYQSNLNGIIGSFQTREDYIRLLKMCRIGLYSTPGMDEGEKRTGGFNPVTPKYLEMLYAQCLLLGRYPKNEETAFCEVDKVCPHIEDYEGFESVMLRYLKEDHVPVELYKQILKKHQTSGRAGQLKQLLKTTV